MVKVFLVEDEVVIRNGIKNGINWEQEQLEFVGEASDGELAYPMILKMKPDILITDIKMPFMDGLELSREIKKEFPQIKILILSGYGEFEYAKQAISLGVQDYLLKPISSVQLLEAIKKVQEKILEEREEQRLRSQFAKESEEYLWQKEQRFFGHLLTKEMSMTQILEESQKLGLDLTAQYYNVLCFKMRKKGVRMGYSDEAVAAEKDILKHVGENQNLYCLHRDTDDLVFLLKGEGREEIQKYTEQVCATLAQIVEKYPNLEYFGGKGIPVTRMRELKDSYYEANAAFSNRYVEIWSQFVENHKGQYNCATGDIPLKNPAAICKNQKMLQKFLHTGTKEEVGEFIQENDRLIGEDDLKSLLFRQYRMLDTYVQVMAFCEEMNYCQEELIEYLGGAEEQAKYVGNLEQEHNYLKNVFEKTIELRDRAADRRHIDTINTARSYIQQNYMLDDMSLNKVAAYVNMSPSYFSSIFSGESGCTFSEFLTRVRMEKARELLMCTDMKTTEIGFKIGYKDSHYFNYIFKKTQSCTPREYRVRGKAHA